jgi:hypothetical protein
MNKNITLIFQGKLGFEVIDMIKNNIEKYNIVLVTNDINNEHILDKLNEFDKLLLIKYKLPINENTNNNYNMYYQFYSTYLGLCNSNTEYSIKFRADEYFENIEPLVNYIINNSNKITTSDFLFRKNYLLKYNISDHYIGGKTDILLSSFKILVEHCKDKNKYIDGYEELNHKEIYSPEKKIAISILIILDVDISFNNICASNIINKYFNIFDSKLMGNFIFTNNNINKKIINNIYTNNIDIITTIKSNNEIYRYCNLDTYDKKIIFLLGNNSIFDNKYNKIFDIINMFTYDDITIYSNDDINNIKSNISIDNYNNYNSKISSDILFIVDNSGINIIYKNQVYTNNLFLLLFENINLIDIDLIDIIIGYVDYIILLNNVNNINKNNILYSNKIIDIENINNYIDIKIDNLDFINII